jgi:hypothetical protein
MITGMKPTSCHLLATVDVEEPCATETCPFWDDTCFVSPLRAELRTNSPLAQFLLGLRENLESASRPPLHDAPGTL